MANKRNETGLTLINIHRNGSVVCVNGRFLRRFLELLLGSKIGETYRVNVDGQRGYLGTFCKRVAGSADVADRTDGIF
jgi:hypothetical protein